MKGSGLGEDLRSELFVILGEKEPRYIVQAEEGKYLRFMVVKILQTMHSSPRHPFFIKYRAQDPRICRLKEELDEDPDHDIPDEDFDLEDTLDFYRREEALAQAEASVDPVLRAIWERYRISRSAQEVARHFGVPYSYIRRRIREFREAVIFEYQKLQK